jgi:hypothetical protein
MVSFLFWNLNKKPLTQLVSELSAERKVDVLILAENPISEFELIQALQQKTGKTYFREFRAPTAQGQKVQVFTCLKLGELETVHDSENGRLTIRTLSRPNFEVLLAVLHLPSKVNWSDDEQSDEAIVYATTICDIEIARKHRNTVIVGDFNMNPFERGMVSARGFHGVMTKAIAASQKRTVQSNEYFYFYNPMWGCFGDQTHGPPGSHFFQGQLISFFWNIFDQVLLRPSLLSADIFQDELLIIDSIGGVSLAHKNGQPKTELASDHFPIWFNLHI